MKGQIIVVSVLTLVLLCGAVAQGSSGEPVKGFDLFLDTVTFVPAGDIVESVLGACKKHSMVPTDEQLSLLGETFEDAGLVLLIEPIDMSGTVERPTGQRTLRLTLNTPKEKIEISDFKELAFLPTGEVIDLGTGGDESILAHVPLDSTSKIMTLMLISIENKEIHSVEGVRIHFDTSDSIPKKALFPRFCDAHPEECS